MWDVLRRIFSARDRHERRLEVILGPERKPLEPGRMARRLSTYPAYTPPHPGLAENLTEAQVDENFEHFLVVRHSRMEALIALAAEFGADLSPLADPSKDALPALQVLDRFLDDHLPERSALPPNPLPNAPDRTYLQSDRAGRDIVFSLAADLSILLGETIIRRRPRWQWAIDRNPDNGPGSRDGSMLHYRRVVLMKPARSEMSEQVYDIELTALGDIYARRGRSIYTHTWYWWVKTFCESEDYFDP